MHIQSDSSQRIHDRKSSSVVYSLNAKMNFKIIVVGNKSVGKTSLILREVKEIFQQNYKVTVGMEFYSKIIQDEDDQIVLQIWDSAGQQQYQSVVRSFYALSNCVLLVYDKPFQLITDVQKWLKQISDRIVPSTQIILVRTKIDILPINDDQKNMVDKIMEKYSMTKFQGVSAKTGTNVVQLFTEIASLMKYLFNNNTQFRERIDNSLKSITTSSNTILNSNLSKSRRLKTKDGFNCCSK